MQLTKYRNLPYPNNLWATVLDREVISEELPRDWEPTIKYLLTSLGNAQHGVILLDYYKNGYSWTKIGNENYICKERARQIAEQAVQKLRHPVNRCVLIYGLANSQNMRERHLGYWAPADDTQSAPAAILSQPVSELYLSSRSYYCLRRANISLISELIQHSEEDLLQFRNLGPKCIQEVRKKLSALGLSLKTQDTQ